jgi:CubicO group peptidase (beta-lactamase class C family)
MVVFIALHFCNLTSSQSFSKIDSIINKEVDEHRVAGGTALIIHEGRVKYNKAFGYSDIAANKKMETHSIFRIASQTKAIVSVGLLQMLEKYEIGLDEPIERFIPAFSNQKVAIIKRDSIQLVERNRPITIRDVLTHQSGISSADEHPRLASLFKKYGLDKLLNMGYKNLEEEIQQIAKMPLAHQPGERFSYGLSTDVAGRLIEIISGMSLGNYLEKNVFKPLEMNDTYFYLPKNKHDRLVKVYTQFRADSLQELSPSVFPVDYAKQDDKGYYSGIGGLVSTTEDYGKFLVCLLNNGKYKNKTLLSKQSMAAFLTNQLGDKTFVFGGKASLNNFGLGVGLTTEKGQVINNASIGSFFWGGAFNTAYMVDPGRKLITLFYFQKAPFVLPPLLSKLEKTTIEIIDGLKH